MTCPPTDGAAELHLEPAFPSRSLGTRGIKYLTAYNPVSVKEKLGVQIPFPGAGEDGHDEFVPVMRAAGQAERGKHRGPGGNAAEDAFPFGHRSGGFQGLSVGYGDDFVNDSPVQHFGNEPRPNPLNQMGAGLFQTRINKSRSATLRQIAAHVFKLTLAPAPRTDVRGARSLKGKAAATAFPVKFFRG